MSAIADDIFEPGFFAASQFTWRWSWGASSQSCRAWSGSSPSSGANRSPATRWRDVGTTGGSGAFLVGANPLLGVRHVRHRWSWAHGACRPTADRGRDVATGVVLGAALGIAALFLYLGTTETNTTGATITILFGSMFVIDPAPSRPSWCWAFSPSGIVGLLDRPLLLSTVSTDLAAARGVPVRTVGALYPARHGTRGVAFVRDDRRDPQHGDVDRAGLCGPPADETARLGDRVGRCDRSRRHLARHPARLRQLLLAPGTTRMAGELLRGGTGLRRLLAGRFCAAAAVSPPGAKAPTRSTHVLRLHGAHLDRGRRWSRSSPVWRVLHGAARLGVRGPRRSSRRVRRCGRRRAARNQHARRAGRVRPRERARHRLARTAGTTRRGDSPRARRDPRPRRALPELERRVRVGDTPCSSARCSA